MVSVCTALPIAPSKVYEYFSIFCWGIECCTRDHDGSFPDHFQFVVRYHYSIQHYIMQAARKTLLPGPRSKKINGEAQKT
jgi:hypothetical protein